MRPYGLACGKYILYLLYIANTLMPSGRWYTFSLVFLLALARLKYIHMGHVGATTPWKPKSKSRINWTKYQHVEQINFIYNPNTTNQSWTYESERENLIEGERCGWRPHESREMNECTKSLRAPACTWVPIPWIRVRSLLAASYERAPYKNSGVWPLCPSLFETAWLDTKIYRAKMWTC